MAKRILIMGLPGAGKTTLAAQLQMDLTNIGFRVEWFNADQVRKDYDDWDFSERGRIRQSTRMRNLADCSRAEIVICDFVAPLAEMREYYDADYTIWVDTIEQGRYEDTNAAFVAPEQYDLRVDTKDATHWASVIVDLIT